MLFDVQVVSSDIICMYINIYTHTHLDDQYLSTSSLIQALTSSLLIGCGFIATPPFPTFGECSIHFPPSFSSVFPHLSLIFHYFPPCSSIVSLNFLAFSSIFCHRVPPTILPHRSALGHEIATNGNYCKAWRLGGNMVDFPGLNTQKAI